MSNLQSSPHSDHKTVAILATTIRKLLITTGPISVLQQNPDALQAYVDARMEARDILRECQV
jgi:hypothetical protein